MTSTVSEIEAQFAEYQGLEMNRHLQGEITHSEMLTRVDRIAQACEDAIERVETDQDESQ